MRSLNLAPLRKCAVRLAVRRNACPHAHAHGKHEAPAILLLQRRARAVDAVRSACRRARGAARDSRRGSVNLGPFPRHPARRRGPHRAQDVARHRPVVGARRGQLRHPARARPALRPPRAAAAARPAAGGQRPGARIICRSERRKHSAKAGPGPCWHAMAARRHSCARLRRAQRRAADGALVRAH